MHQNDLINELKGFWQKLVFFYTGDIQLIEKCWAELLHYYTGPHRYYHNLNHVYSLIRFIEINKPHILNHHSLLFAAFYHDVIYEVTQKNNEALSAELAEKRLRELGVDEPIIALTVHIINQTASHIKTDNFDINLFLDFDRCVLSGNEQEYFEYKDQIRKEYYIFNDSIYKTLRLRFLQRYLSQPEIYFTAINKGKEQIARRNLERELQELLLQV